MKRWNILENRKIFFDKIAFKYNIKEPKDWGKISTFQIIEEKGGKRLLVLYGNSIFRALSSTYTEMEWEEKWFHEEKSKEFWLSKQNQVLFLRHLFSLYNFKSDEEIAKRTTTRLLLKHSAFRILQLYQYSIYNLLTSVFPGFSLSDCSVHPIRKRMEKRMVCSLFCTQARVLG